MKYINAAEILPQQLIDEIYKHINGGVLYIPRVEKRTGWGEKNGTKNYFIERNKNIKQQYKDGYSIEKISTEHGLAYETIRKIIYKKQYE